MDKKEVLSKLCYYDRRNTEGFFSDMTEEEIKENIDAIPSPCYCDNCFYGRAKLANYILTLNL